MFVSQTYCIVKRCFQPLQCSQKHPGPDRWVRADECTSPSVMNSTSNYITRHYMLLKAGGQAYFQWSNISEYCHGQICVELIEEGLMLTYFWQHMVLERNTVWLLCKVYIVLHDLFKLFRLKQLRVEWQCAWAAIGSAIFLGAEF